MWEKIKIFLYFWLLNGTNNKKIWRLIEFLFRNLANLGFFFSWKILPLGRNHIFPVGICLKFASKRNIDVVM
jgi:hypothetical protein